MLWLVAALDRLPRLWLLRSTEPRERRNRKTLCFSDDAAARPFQSRRSWYAGALRTLDVQIHVVDLPAEWRRRIVEAQQRQYR